MKKQLQILTLMALIKSLLLISNASAQSCPSDLASYWRMDETTGYVLSETKNNYTATRNSLTGPVTGKIDNSQRFTFTVNGTNDGYSYFEYASVPDNSAFDFAAGSSFTISYWCRFSDYEYGIQDHIILSKGDWEGGGAGPEGMFGSGCNGSGKINFLLRDNLGNGVDKDVETAGGYGDGTWHHVACVRDASSSKNILYIDGVNRGERVVTYTGNFGNANDLQFGALIDNGIRGFYYKGDLDEVAIFNRALSVSDIATIISDANLGDGLCSFVDQPPVITSAPVTTALVGQPYSYDVQATGTSPITYSLVTAPANMTINATSGLIAWTPANITTNGLVNVRANNGIAPADTQTFRINIGEGAACPSDLMVLLKLDEASGPTYADYYGSHNATGTVPPSATTGKINGAQLFNASTKVDLPDNGTEFDWASTASFSFSCWIKTSTTAGQVAIGRNRIDYTTAASWWMGVNASGYAAFELRDNGSNNSVLSGTKLLNDGQWHYLVAVRDNSTDLNKLYVDGVLEASASINYPNSFIADNPTEINIGWLHRAESGQPEYHFVGSIDEVAIFNRAVSTGEVTSFYNSGNPAGYCSISNYAPVITSTPIAQVNEEEAYSYTFTTNDLDASDVLVLSAVTKPSWLTFNWVAGQKTATLTGTPNSSQAGAHSVTLRVSDGDVQIDQSFTITVIDVNTDPEVTSTPVTSINEDQAYSYTITVTDPDASDVINMTATSKPDWLTFTYTAGAKTASLTGTPANTDIGTSGVDISITDGHQTIHHTFNITVNSVNDLPVISAQSDLNTNEDVAITLQKANFTITDEDNNLSDITFRVEAGTNYTFTGNTVTPAANFNGQLTVNVVARDLTADGQVFHATITVNAVNDPPVVTSPPAATDGYVGNLYAYVFTASDIDDATLTKSVVQKPDWLSFSAANGVLTGTPAQADKGQHLVILRVSDGKIDTDYDFIITVGGPDAIESLEAAGIHVFPIPARNNLEISMENAMEATCVDVISSVGNVVKKAIIPANQQSFSLDLEGIESGTYYLRLSNDSMQRIGRIVVLK